LQRFFSPSSSHFSPPHIEPPHAEPPHIEPPHAEPNASAAGAASLRRTPRTSLKLRRRVVTQQKLFSPPVCDRPGCHETPVKSGRNQARYCGPACRQAVRRVRDRERKWLFRSTFQGRCAREREYRTPRVRHSGAAPNSASASSPQTQPP